MSTPGFGVSLSSKKRAWWHVVLLCFATLGASGADWSQTKWQGEDAWSSSQGALQAVVSVARGRLIYFGSTDGAHNLLSAPVPRETPTKETPAPNWGGHRFWPGPQSRWGWPPLPEWEFSAAASVQSQNDELILDLQHSDPKYPALRRVYHWEGERLACRVFWKGGAEPSYGMHVVAIDAPAEFRLHLVPWVNVPHGVVAVNGDTPEVRSVLPHSAVSISGRTATIKSGIAVGKFGFVPQPISVTRGDLTFTVAPGPIHGTAIESPDFGYLTQLWVGRAANTFCEMEQLTPYLLPAEDGWCGSTIFLLAK